MDNPLISIIVPVYKVEQYLEKCIKSILAQTYTNFELILVDDGSPDSCPEICEEYAKIDNRIVVIHKENGGLSDARNAGLDIAKGAYIGFVDSDDYIAPEMYEVLLKQMQTDQSEMACCNYLQVDENDIPYENQELPLRDGCIDQSGAFVFLTRYGGYYGIACNKLYRREVFDEIRYPYGRKFEDFFIIFKVLDKCQRISHVSLPMYYYVRREGSITLEKQSIKDLDLGYALISMRSFSIKRNIMCLREYSTNRLAYKIEEWGNTSKTEKAFQKEYLQLCKKCKFLLYDKYAWNAYSWKGRIVARIRLVVALRLHKILF